MKKWLCALLVVLLLGTLLAGCGNNTTADKETGSTGANTEATTQEATKSAEKVTISVLSYETDANDTLEKFKEAFQGKFNANVDMTYIPNEQYKNVLNTKLASGDAPDVIEVWMGPHIGQLVKADYLMDVSNEAFVKRIMPQYAPSVTFDGKAYGVPNLASFFGMYVNNKVLKDAGITDMPKNYKEFLEDCEKIKAKGYVPLAHGDKEGITGLVMVRTIVPIFLKGTENADITSKKIKITGSQAWKRGWTILDELNDKGYLPKDVLGLTMDQGNELFTTDKAAFAITGSWALANLMKANPNLDLSIIPVPFNDESEKAVAYGEVGAGWTISKDTKQAETAKKWLDYVTTQEGFDAIGKKVVPCIEGINVELDKPIADFVSNYGDTVIPKWDDEYPVNLYETCFKLAQELEVENGITVDELLGRLDDLITKAK